MTLPRTGFIDHIGIGVPDLGAAKQYYDELMSVLGLREWFDTGPGGPLNYGPDGGQGAQLFFYRAEEPATYSRHQTGLHHLAFLVREPCGRSRGARVGSWTRAAIVSTGPASSPSRRARALHAVKALRTLRFQLEGTSGLRACEHRVGLR